MARDANPDLIDDPRDLPILIGRRLRERRSSLGMTLSEVARRAEMSDSHLSAIEIGHKVASLPILARIVGVLGLSLHDILQDAATVTVHDGRIDDAGAGASPLSHDELMLRVMALVAQPGESGPSPIPMTSSEIFVYVHEGAIEVTVDGEPFVLESGDSLDTDPPDSVSYRSVGETPSISVWASVCGGSDD